MKSVDFKKAQDRIVKIIGIDLHETDKTYLETLRNLRNSIMHFKLSISKEQIQSIVQKGWALFLKLYEDESLKTNDQEWKYEISSKLKPFDEFIKARVKDLQEQLSISARPSSYFRRCSMCAQDTLVLNKDYKNADCLFCGEHQSLDDLAYTHEGSGGKCPKCRHGYLGFVLFTNEGGKFYCNICDFSSEKSYNEECSRCGEVYWNEKEQAVCDTCWDEAMTKD